MWVKGSKVRAPAPAPVAAAAEEDEEDEVLDGSAVRATGLTVLTRWVGAAAGLEGRISMVNDGPQGSLLAALPSAITPLPL